MSTVQYLTVRNFERFQHYKNRRDMERPAWIKLYAGLLHDYEFQQLRDEAKSHLMLIWLLVSQRHDQKIPNDPKWVAAKIGADSKVDLQILIDAGFLVVLEDSSEDVAGRSRASTTNVALLSSTSLSSSQEGECEGEPADDFGKLQPEDLQEAWNDYCAPQGLAAVREISVTRRKKALQRIREHPDAKWWEQVFARIRGSPFLLGLNSGNGNGKHEHWKASFDWLIENDTNAVKIIEGKYT